MSFAASPAAAARMNVGDPFHFAVRQCVFAAGAAVILIGTSMLEVKVVRRASFFIWLAAIAIMIILPFIGHNAKGATRWLEFGGFTLQPSEFMKPALIILVAWMFAEGQKGQVPGVAIAFALYAISVALLLIQPDVGQTVLITVAFGAAFFMAGVPMSWVIVLGSDRTYRAWPRPISYSRTWRAGCTASSRPTPPTPTRWIARRKPSPPAASSAVARARAS
jgi:cell division protein FtsW